MYNVFYYILYMYLNFVYYNYITIYELDVDVFKGATFF